jgi:hypothetical protein
VPEAEAAPFDPALVAALRASDAALDSCKAGDALLSETLVMLLLAIRPFSCGG